MKQIKVNIHDSKTSLRSFKKDKGTQIQQK